MDEELERYRAEQAHAYLEQIRRMGRTCAALQDLVDDARARAEGVTGIDYAAVRVTKSLDPDRMADLVEQIREGISDYIAALAEYEGERMRANAAIMSMPDYTSARILRLRYLCGWQWEKICVDMAYSYDWMMKLRRRALAEFYEYMPHDRRDALVPAV